TSQCAPANHRPDESFQPDAPLRNDRRAGRADPVPRVRRIVLHHRVGAAGGRRRPRLTARRAGHLRTHPVEIHTHSETTPCVTSIFTGWPTKPASTAFTDWCSSGAP